MKKRFAVLTLALGLLLASCGKTKEHNVTFDLGYTGAPAPIVEVVKDGELVSRPATDPIRDNHRFIDWFESLEANSKKYDFTLPVKKALTIYAHWEENLPVVDVTVTFDLNYEGSQAVTKTIDSGTKIEPLSPAPTRENYALAGWYVGAENGADPFNFDTPVVANLTLYAHWDATTIFGSGTKTDPYQIANANNLVSFGNWINEGALGKDEAFYTITADIDLKGEEFTPIGNATRAFSGVLFGNDHVIKNLSITELELKETDVEFFVGLFGRLNFAQIYDLHLENVNIVLEGEFNAQGNVGGLAGEAVLTIISGSSVDGGQIKVNNTIDRDDATRGNVAIVGGLVGYTSSSHLNGQGMVVFNEFNSTNIKIEVQNSNSAGVGGLYGIVSGGFGIYTVSDSCSRGDIIVSVRRGTSSHMASVGGITGEAGNLTAFQNVYSTSNIAVENKGPAYTGGLIGNLGQETIILYSASLSTSITSQVSTSAYKSFAGGLVGYADTEYDGYRNGAAAFKAISNTAVTIGTGVENQLFGEAGDLAAVKASFADPAYKWNTGIWDLSGDLPVLKNDADRQVKATATVTLDNNLGVDGGSQTVEIETRNYDPTKILNAVPTKQHATDGFQFNQWFYDEACTIPYRFYAPTNSDVTLHALWVDYNEVKGQYTGKDAINGTLEINNDGTMNWIIHSGEVAPGTYTYDGTFFIFSTTYYYQTIAIVDTNAHTIVFQDTNADYYTYTFTRQSVEFETMIPDYTNKPFLGEWLADNAKIELYDNGNMLAKIGTLAASTGAYRDLENGKISIYATGTTFVVGETTYDQERSLIYGTLSGNFYVFSQNTQTGYFADKTEKVYISAYGESVYVFHNNDLTNAVVNGNLAEGATITLTIDEVVYTYLIQGKTLVLQSKVEPEPPVDYSAVINTYKGIVNGNDTILELQDQGVGTFNGTAITYTYKDSVVHFTVNNDVYTLTHDGETLTGTVLVGGTTAKEVTLSVDGQTARTTLEGVWKFNSNTLVISDDLSTVAYNGAAVSDLVIDANAATISFKAGGFIFNLALTDGKLVGDFDDGYDGPRPLTFTYEGPNVVQPSPFAGTWVGKVGMANVTLVVSDDLSTATYNGTNGSVTVKNDGNEILIVVGDIEVTGTIVNGNVNWSAEIDYSMVSATLVKQ